MTLFTQPTPTITDAVRKDRLDRLDWVAAREIGSLKADAAALAEVNPAAPDVLGDLYASFVKAHPELTPTNEVAASHVVNRAVMAEVMASDAYRDLRQYSVRDQVSSALACVTYQRHLAPLFEHVHEQVAEEQHAAEEAERNLDDLVDRLDPDDHTAEDLAAIEEAQGRVDEIRESLAQKMEGLTPVVGRAARAAGAEAAAAAEEEADAMAAWGTGPGERERMDATARLKLAERLASPRLRKITQLLGAMRNLSWGVRKERYDLAPEEMFDVTVGADVGRLLASEYAALTVPELEDLFYLRLTQRQLLQYDLRGIEHQGRGAIIYVEDGSGSMRHGGGDKELWAKAFGLALLGVAKDEGRAFHAIHFGGVGEAELFSFPEPAAFTTERMLDYAETFLNAGGTDFITPLTEALALLEAEHAATGHVSADIVFATDGDDGGRVLSWLPTFKEAQARLEFNTFAVAIGTSPSHPSITGVADRVATVRALTNGDDVRDVFKALA